MQRLDVELVDRLDRHKAHGRPLHGLGDRLGVAEVVLLALHERLHELRRDDLHLVPQARERAAEMVGADARPMP